MALRFLYLFFLVVAQLIRLSGLDREKLAVEVVMLRHEVAVAGTTAPPPTSRMLLRPTRHAPSLAQRSGAPALDLPAPTPSTSTGPDGHRRPRPVVGE
jgi:hypothetical protein